MRVCLFACLVSLRGRDTWKNSPNRPLQFKWYLTTGNHPWKHMSHRPASSERLGNEYKLRIYLVFVVGFFWLLLLLLLLLNITISCCYCLEKIANNCPEKFRFNWFIDKFALICSVAVAVVCKLSIFYKCLIDFIAWFDCNSIRLAGRQAVRRCRRHRADRVGRKQYKKNQNKNRQTTIS